MSKFIRTKEGIYDTSKGLYTPSIKMWAIGFITIYDDQILKQADTIEELCDGIIMTYTEFKTEYYVYEKLDDIPLLDLKCKNKYFNIYGFIETDKGLIYVAKLNDKGDLELI